ncbi:MAG TPA: Na+/H+ antiporter subunit E [Micromonosporaceae bacterium]|nr:Na+/H+ antiporter subunit E [Micromonosporaceae bacterium]
MTVRARRHLIGTAVLTVVWVILWRRLDAATILSGLLVASAAVHLVRLPTAQPALRARPWLPLGIVSFLATLVTSSVSVGWLAIRRPHRIGGAIIRVPLESRSQQGIALIAASITVEPGSVVIYVDRAASTLIVHGIPAADQSEVEKLRDETHVAEDRFLRSFRELPQPQDQR